MRKKIATVGHIFEEEFALESLKSDRLRVRIEKLNKTFDSQLLISEMVWQAINEERRNAVPMGHVQVKGREQAIQVYQVH